MAGTQVLNKRYDNFGGYDLRSDRLTNPLIALEAKNAIRLDTGPLAKRPGGKTSIGSQGGLGLPEHIRVDSSTGAVTSEILSIGASLYRVITSSITLTYSGSATGVTLTVYVDSSTSTWKFKLIADGTTDLDYDMGLGFDEASPKTLANLKTAVDALSDYAMSISGTTSTPAAIALPMLIAEPFASGSLVVSFLEYEAVNQPTGASNPFAGSVTNRSDDDFENVVSINLNNVTYFSNGYNELKKYDGVDVYRAGMPQGSLSGVAAGASGSLSGDYIYIISYIQKDAQGNIVEGIESDDSSTVSPSTQSVNVTVNNVLDSTGFNTDCAVAAGAQSGVTTITVDDGSGGTHSMKVGQIAYFYDGVSSSYVEREITAVAATTITISGANVNIADNAVISNNLRIGIYRTFDGGIDKYLVAEIPNNSFNTTQVYVDDIVDGSLGAKYLYPLVSHGLPPKGRYITAHQNLLIVAGIFDEPTTVHFSDVLSPEYFGSTQSFDVKPVNSKKISGIHSNGEFLAVFQEKSTHLAVGDLTTFTFTVELVSADIGCVAHNALVEIQGVLFVLTTRGVRPLINGAYQESISEQILPIFNRRDLPDDQKPVFKRAVATHDEYNQRYLLYVPAEETTTSELHPNEFQRVYAYDYTRGEWWPWTNINAAGGLLVIDEEMYWSERRYSTFGSTMSYQLHRRHKTKTNYDFKDDVSATPFRYETGWETLGEPSVYKNFNKLKVFSLDAYRAATFDIQIQTRNNFNSAIHTDLTLSFGAGGSSLGWGLSTWGMFPWGNPSTPYKRASLKRIKSQAQQYIFINDTIDEGVLISAWETQVAAPYRREIKQYG